MKIAKIRKKNFDEDEEEQKTTTSATVAESSSSRRRIRNIEFVRERAAKYPNEGIQKASAPTEEVGKKEEKNLRFLIYSRPSLNRQALIEF